MSPARKKPSAAKKPAGKKAPVRKPPVRKAGGKKAAAGKKATGKKAAVRKTGVRKAPDKKAAGKKAAGGWRARFEAMVHDLKANPRVEIEKVRFGPPATEAEVAAARAANGGQLPEAMETLYRELGEFELIWWAKLPEATRDSQTWSGRMHLQRLGTVFGSWKDILYFPDIHGADHVFGSIRPVDFFIAEACSVLYPVTGQAEKDQQVCFHYCGEELLTTGLSYERWLELLLLSRGFWYWIETCTEDKGDSFQADNFRTVMPQVFPGLDLSVFKPSGTSVRLYG